MKTESLAFFQHDIGAGCKLVKATEFLMNDGTKQWRVCIIKNEDAVWLRPESRIDAIQAADDAIGKFVREIYPLYD